MEFKDVHIRNIKRVTLNSNPFHYTKIYWGISSIASSAKNCRLSNYRLGILILLSFQESIVNGISIS